MLIARNTVAAETVFMGAILSSITGIVNYKMSTTFIILWTYIAKNLIGCYDFSNSRLVYIVFFEYVMPYK